MTTTDKEIKNGLAVTLVVVAVFLFFMMTTISWGIGKYNTFVIAKQDIDNQWSNVMTEYQRRTDLIVNMAEVVKAYSEFEKDTMTQVIQARNQGLGTTKAEQMQNMAEMDSALARLMVVAEKYPDLKAIEQYNRLSAELQRTENRVQTARTDYNSLVRSYNILIKKFPNNILAGWFGYVDETFYESQAGTEAAPRLDME